VVEERAFQKDDINATVPDPRSELRYAGKKHAISVLKTQSTKQQHCDVNIRDVED
jgi:hypothetical protein